MTLTREEKRVLGDALDALRDKMREYSSDDEYPEDGDMEIAERISSKLGLWQ